MSDLVCSEPGCGARITHQSRTGRCRPHAIARMHADPAYQAARAAGLAAYYDKPGARAAAGQRLRDYNAALPQEERERRRVHGRWLYAQHASREEVAARAQSPAARERAAASYVETRMGWCPPPLRPAYHALVRKKGIPAPEARRIIEAEISGTVEHARKEIANRELAARLRQQRERKEAY